MPNDAEIDELLMKFRAVVLNKPVTRQRYASATNAALSLAISMTITSIYPNRPGAQDEIDHAEAFRLTFNAMINAVESQLGSACTCGNCPKDAK